MEQEASQERELIGNQIYGGGPAIEARVAFNRHMLRCKALSRRVLIVAATGGATAAFRLGLDLGKMSIQAGGPAHHVQTAVDTIHPRAAFLYVVTERKIFEHHRNFHDVGGSQLIARRAIAAATPAQVGDPERKHSCIKN